MAEFYLGIGSNKNRTHNINSCVTYLSASFSTLKCSPVYQSKAYGFEGQDFYNLVVKLQSAFDPWQMKAWLQNLEDLLGRDRSQPRYSDRLIDIDLLLVDDLIIDDGVVQIPRREILKRAYVIKPLSDLAPDLIVPGHKKRLADLWQAFELKQDIQPVTCLHHR
ncbi:2-amino-4-hydroxy-6-hydroxymethyldihydropteridine diphosphokinase [Marinicella rhabdoformis]|uniref:2-amino-4-hydroxy-6- hydroxymethyldihydropteridine diphosphokinase n=1 Tax=Marinicella rhabdoformis TaxID=2580566 RepID=UPI0012AED768|nr:2-amino-4-hydroxy-6-hydroxymethyldihydropteridine diphosphokinase [Marinicella rhabdoformis]